MGDFNRDGTSGTLMRGPIDLNGLPEADKAKAGLEIMQRRAQREDLEAALQHLNHVVPDIPPDAEDLHHLDWLLFSNWRLPDGWLSLPARKRAMEIFHDGLAIQMRRAVIAQLYLDRTEFPG